MSSSYLGTNHVGTIILGRAYRSGRSERVSIVINVTHCGHVRHVRPVKVFILGPSTRRRRWDLITSIVQSRVFHTETRLLLASADPALDNSCEYSQCGAIKLASRARLGQQICGTRAAKVGLRRGGRLAWTRRMTSLTDMTDPLDHDETCD